MASSSDASNDCPSLRKLSTAFPLVFILLGVPGVSLAQGSQDVCPKGYSVFETVCLHDVTGEVVNQTRANGAAGTSSPAPGPSNAPAPPKSGG